MAEYNGQLHPEIKEELDRLANAYIKATYSIKEGINWEVEACNNKIISDDDIKFLGIVSGASALSLDHLIDSGKAPMIEVELDGKLVKIANTKDPEFKEALKVSEFILAGMYFGKTPKEIERRFYAIGRKVVDYQNRKNCDKQG